MRLDALARSRFWNAKKLKRQITPDRNGQRMPSRSPVSCLLSFVVLAIGTGTFGRVYLTKFRHDHSFYAMKVLKKTEVVRLKQVEHINSEKQILSQVHFPFIVNLYVLMDAANANSQQPAPVCGRILYSRLDRFFFALSPSLSPSVVTQIHYVPRRPQPLHATGVCDRRRTLFSSAKGRTLYKRHDALLCRRDCPRD